MPSVSVWANVKDSDAVLVWEEISLHPAGTAWDSTWAKLPIEERQTTHKKNSGYQLIGSGTIPELRYHHTFIDLEQGSSLGNSLEDIVEPIATPFSAYGGKGYRINIDLLIIEQQLFAIDAEVIEE